MSLFDYPRINVTGTCTLTPGTANNDDYSDSYRWPPTGENLALIDSASVKPRTFGMSKEPEQSRRLADHRHDCTTLCFGNGPLWPGGN